MSEKYEDYTMQELMVVAAAREIRDGERIIVGTGLPLLAACLAQKTHAPNIMAIYESGAIDCKPKYTPFSVADSVLVPGAAMQGGLIDGLGIVHAGDIDVGFLSGAQIDKYGNINTHVIGNYYKPKIRFAGSGGNNDIGCCCHRTIIIMLHQRQRFPEKVDFVTTPGYFEGNGQREKYGFLGGGPSVVVTTLGILRFNRHTKEMFIDSYHPGISIEEIKANTDWDIMISENVKETKPPEPELIKVLREELDPTGIFLKKV